MFIVPNVQSVATYSAGWFVLLVASLQTQISAAELATQSPQEFQVFQRADRYPGTFKLHGRSSVESEKCEYRIAG